MVYINEWLPNPTGPDAAGEFIELYNGGNAAVNLNGWSLITSGAKKPFVISGRVIAAGGYLVLPRSETKLTLKNSDESLQLYDAAGRLADQSAFAGAAPEGKSFSRIDYGAADVQHFAFTTSTPGAPNGTIDNRLTVRGYAYDVPLNAARLNTAQFFAMMMGVALLLAALVAYAITTNENLSQLFFGRDQGPGS